MSRPAIRRKRGVVGEKSDIRPETNGKWQIFMQKMKKWGVGTEKFFIRPIRKVANSGSKGKILIKRFVLNCMNNPPQNPTALISKMTKKQNKMQNIVDIMKNTCYYHYCKADGETEMLITQGTADYM